MGYQFDRKHLKNEIESLKKSAAFCGNIEKAYQLNALKNAYEYLLYLTSMKYKLKVIKEEIIKSGKSPQPSIKKEKSILENAGECLPVINAFYNQVKDVNVSSERLSRKRYTQEEILQFTYDFFEKQPTIIFEKFLKVFETKDYALRFSNPFFLHAKGVTHKLPGIPLSYISLSDSKSIESLLISIHEYGHAISNCFHRTSSGNRDLLGEVEAIFWELVGTDFISDSLDLEWQAEMYRRIKFNRYKQKAYGVVYRENIHQIENVPVLSYPSQLSKDFTVTTDTIKYLTSYIVAIDLYYLYLNDPDYAIYLLKNHMSHTKDDTTTLHFLKSEGLLTGENLKKEIHRLELRL